MTAHTIHRPPLPDGLAAAMTDPRLSWVDRGILAFAKTRQAHDVVTLAGIFAVSPSLTDNDAILDSVQHLVACGYAVTAPGHRARHDQGTPR